MKTFQTAPSENELETIRRGFESRRDSMIRALSGKPFTPAKKQNPLGPGRGMYVRAYAYSVTDFAMRAFWLEEQIPEANAAVSELCRFYIANPLERDDPDNFYWAADILGRLLEFFGRKGSRHPGLMSPECEELLRQTMWLWAKKHSSVTDADWKQSRTWHIWASENHHLQRFSTCWHFTKWLKDDPQYAHQPLDDGHPAAEHYTAWTAYAKEYLRERARKGLFIETANGNYGYASLKGIYNFYDFADDPVLRRLAGLFLDLYWACWAQEQLDGVRGGGKARIYAGSGSISGYDSVSRAAWYYLNVGTNALPRANDFTILTSQYRLPLLVMDLALDPKGRGTYEIREYPLGAAEPGFHQPPLYRVRTDAREIVRYSYCTPAFVMGTLMFPARPLEYWTAISAQNRWQGIIFAGHPDARIFPQCRPISRNRSYNPWWSVQSRGTLITQKLPTSKGAAEMRIWFSRPGLTNRVEEGGWVFVETTHAIAAVRPATGGYIWQPDENAQAGDWLVCQDSLSPVILEVVQKKKSRPITPPFENRSSPIPSAFGITFWNIPVFTGIPLFFLQINGCRPLLMASRFRILPPKSLTVRSSRASGIAGS